MGFDLFGSFFFCGRFDVENFFFDFVDFIFGFLDGLGVFVGGIVVVDYCDDVVEYMN